MVDTPSIDKVLKIIANLEANVLEIEPQIASLKSGLDKALSAFTAEVNTLANALKATSKALTRVQQQIKGALPPQESTHGEKPPVMLEKVVPPIPPELEVEDEIPTPIGGKAVLVARLFSEVVRVARAGAGGETVGAKLLEVRDLIQDKVPYSPVYHEMATFARLLNTYGENAPPEDTLEVLKRRVANWQGRLKT